MKFIRLTTDASVESVKALLADNNRVNEGVRFAKGEPHPLMHLRQKGDRIHLRCEMAGGPTRDNGFIQSTFFFGTLKEQEGKSVLRGVIVTEPIFHLLWFGLLVFFVVNCIRLGGISVIPLCLSAFILFMFNKEYKKQAIIRAYLLRAFRRLEQEGNR